MCSYAFQAWTDVEIFGKIIMLSADSMITAPKFSKKCLAKTFLRKFSSSDHVTWMAIQEIRVFCILT